MRGWGFSVAQSGRRSAIQLADMLTGRLAEFAKQSRASRETSADVGPAPNGAISGGPRSKMAAVVARAESVGEIQGFKGLTWRANALRSRELTLTCVAGCIRSWGRFCGMAPSGEAVLARPTCFSEERAF